MAHRKWNEIKQQPSMLPGPAVPDCSLVSFYFLWAILSTGTVHYLIDELIVPPGIAPEGPFPFGEGVPDAAGDPVVLLQPDVLHGEEERVRHRAVVAAHEVAALLMRVRMGTLG